MDRARHWVRAHRHVLALKGAVAVALVAAHYYPGSSVALAVNLVWLALF